MPAASELNDYSNDLKTLLKKHALKPGEVATFRLLQGSATLEGKDSEDNKFSFQRHPAAFRMLRMESIIDPGTGRPIRIANLKGYQTSAIPGQPLTPDIGEVVFKASNDGLINVGFDDVVLYERLLISDYNTDSPNPRKRTPATGCRYQLVKPDQEAKNKLNKRLAVSRVVRAVEELGDERANLVNYCQKLSIPTERNGRELTAEELQLELVNLAEAAPERVEAVLDAGERKLEKLVEQAQELKIIDFNRAENEWRWTATQQVICHAIMGYQPEAALLQFIQNHVDGPTLSQNLAKRIAQEEGGKKK